MTCTRMERIAANNGHADKALLLAREMLQRVRERTRGQRNAWDIEHIGMLLDGARMYIYRIGEEVQDEREEQRAIRMGQHNTAG